MNFEPFLFMTPAVTSAMAALISMLWLAGAALFGLGAAAMMMTP